MMFIKEKEKEPKEKKPKRNVSVVSDSIDNKLIKIESNVSQSHNLLCHYLGDNMPHFSLDYNPPLSPPHLDLYQVDWFKGNRGKIIT